MNLNGKDNGLIDYLLDLFWIMETSYRKWVETMFSVIQSNPKEAYTILENLSRSLSLNKEWAKGVLELIRLKEWWFGGLFTLPVSRPNTLYEWKRHCADMFSLEK